MARVSLFGSGIPSREGRSAGKRGSGTAAPAKKAPPLSQILRDARDLIAARKGRLVLGLAFLIVNRVAGLVLPGTTKFLLDEVIGKGHRELLGKLVMAAG